MSWNAPDDVDAVVRGLAAHHYLADRGLATAIFLALRMRRPLLLEGEAGVGKTEVAKVLAVWLASPLIRLQCYEGIDAAQAVYEWDYARQLLHLRALEAGHAEVHEDELYDERFLVRRPLLAAVDHGGDVPPVLLVDEIDRADDEFEALLLEVLSESAVTVPEIGTIRATVPPIAVLTSNRTRDVHDTLKRRCLYHWIEHPDLERELAIVRLRAPDVPEDLAHDVARAVADLRGLDLYKAPGVAETIDWATALAALGAGRIDEHAAAHTIGTVLKYREDQARLAEHGIDRLVRDARSRASVNPTLASMVLAYLARRQGIAVPVGATITLAGAFALVDTADREQVYWAGRATLVHRPELAAAYDAAFACFWDGRAGLDAPVALSEVLRSFALAFDDGTPPDGDEDDDGSREDVEVLTVRWSDREVLRHRDFATYTQPEHEQADRLLRDLELVAARRRSRRLRPARRPRQARPDVRRTVRDALRTGGEPLRLRYRAPTTRPRRVVLLLDVSGSMEPYARAFVRFLHSAVTARSGVEAFALGTRLTRITKELAARDPDAAIAAAARRVADWSGGTRLGPALRTFNDTWGIRGMAHGAIVVILSDGWDRGGPELLGEQMARLARVAHRIVWVNPLKASEGYAPLAQGMAAALPYVDDFVEGHSLAALDGVAAAVARA